MSPGKADGPPKRRPAAKKAPARKPGSPERAPRRKPKDDPFRDFVIDQLRDVQGVVLRAMFGGYGLYRGETFFGVVYKGRLFFKTDENSVAAYSERGMEVFSPWPGLSLKQYFEVPADVLEDSEQLAVWARRALAVKPQA